MAQGNCFSQTGRRCSVESWFAGFIPGIPALIPGFSGLFPGISGFVPGWFCWSCNGLGIFPGSEGIFLFAFGSGVLDLHFSHRFRTGSHCFAPSSHRSTPFPHHSHTIFALFHTFVSG
jgi:hypothetical protein